ncbi:MAG: hypothetical protein P4L22_01110 [Candidatus Babeliales bacterium]|nr:hypothetical protein [Candidatus Babeliales bacterium]
MKKILFILLLMPYGYILPAMTELFRDTSNMSDTEQAGIDFGESYNRFIIQFNNYNDYEKFINIQDQVYPSGHITQYDAQNYKIDFEMDNPISLNQIQDFNIYNLLAQQGINLTTGLIWSI